MIAYLRDRRLLESGTPGGSATLEPVRPFDTDYAEKRGLWLTPFNNELRYRAASALVVIIAVGLPLSVGIAGDPTLRDVVTDPLEEIERIPELLPVILAGVFSALPAFLFFAFDRFQVQYLTDAWTRDLLRIDREAQTIDAIEMRYGSRIRDALSGTGTGSAFGIRLAPVIVSTILIAVGWSQAMVQTPIFGGLASGVSNLEEIPLQTFAFLGAYFYIITALLRGYQQRDLRPSLYSSALVRVAIAMLLAPVLEHLLPQFSDNLFLASLAFFVGIVPERVVRVISAQAQVVLNRSFQSASKQEHSQFPGEDVDLSRTLLAVQGLDLTERERLSDLGIYDLTTLALSDPVDIMLRSRRPMAQIIDLVDQALLLLRLKDMFVVERLRMLGIRTATDLISANIGTLKRTESTVKALKMDIYGIASAIRREQAFRAIVNWRRAEDKPPRLDQEEQVSSTP